jgi:hypothetical protein
MTHHCHLCNQPSTSIQPPALTCFACRARLREAKRLTIIETPFRSSNLQQAITYKNYLNACLLHSISLDETPFASHALYTSCLDDADAVQRRQGMALGFNFHHHALAMAVYTDHGISDGMTRAIAHATGIGLPIAYRTLSTSQAEKHNADEKTS